MTMTMIGCDQSYILSFCQTVQGRLHIERDEPCEDTSECWCSESGQAQIALVSDGHGSSACFRSETGAKFAVEAAMNCLQKFVAPLDRSSDDKSIFLAQLTSQKKQVDTIRRLIDVIINDWYEKVEKDIAEYPITDEVLIEHPCDDADMSDYQKGENLAHIYGATLIASVYTPDYLILIQKGDGHCVVFYEDGTVEEPIPWDDRCHENVTTSLSQPDAAETTKFCVVSLQEHPLAACYLGCDGVEDSFTDMEGTYSFYRELSVDLVSNGAEEFLKTLPQRLQNLSDNGSGDDVTVAAIVDLHVLEDLRESFASQSELYSLRKLYRKYAERIESMERKRGYLKRRVEEKEQEAQNLNINSCNKGTDECLDHEIEENTTELESRRKELTEYEEQYEELMQQYKEVEKKLIELGEQIVVSETENDNIDPADGPNSGTEIERREEKIMGEESEEIICEGPKESSNMLDEKRRETESSDAEENKLMDDLLNS